MNGRVHCLYSQVLRKGVHSMTWIYEARLYDSRSVANYVAMCVRDDQVLRGQLKPLVQIYKTRKGNYGVRYQPSGSY